MFRKIRKLFPRNIVDMELNNCMGIVCFKVGLTVYSRSTPKDWLSLFVQYDLINYFTV